MHSVLDSLPRGSSIKLVLGVFNQGIRFFIRIFLYFYLVFSYDFIVMNNIIYIKQGLLKILEWVKFILFEPLYALNSF